MSEPSIEPQIGALIESLQSGLPRDLDDQEVAALLGWIASSSRNPGAQVLSDALGPSGENEALTGQAFSLLDEAIFDGENLLTEPAGVSEEREHNARRRRYRLLLSAFHPDRFPARADWLTSRSQVITRAYARFKTGETDELPAAEPAPPSPGQRPPEYRGITPNWRLADRLRSRWGQDRFLAHKIIGLLALFLLLPVVSILLDQRPQSPAETEGSSRPRINLDALDLAVEQWPLASLAAPWLEADPAGPGSGEPELPSPSESLWTTVQSVAATGMPDWLDRARVGSFPGRSSDSPGLQMLAFLGETWQQIDAMTTVSDALDSLPESSLSEASLPEPSLREPIAQAVAEPVPEPVPEPVAESGTRGNSTTSRTPERQAAAPASQAPGPANQVASTTTNRPNQPNQQNQDRQPNRTTDELPRGSIHLGPLANHQVGDLLSDYRSSIEAGDLEGVLNVLGRQPRDNNRIGRAWFEQYYRELFNASTQRSLSLQILNATRHEKGWRVAAQYQLDMRDADSGENDRLERDVEFVILPDPFRLKIVAVEY